MIESQDPIVQFISVANVSVPVYFRLLSEPELVSVKFENSGDIVIPDQMFKKNIKGSTIDAFLSPFKTRNGYTYSGMYYDDLFAEPVGSNDTITTETIIFLEWTENVVNKVWGETEDTIIVEEVNTFYNDTSIPALEYVNLLPSVTDYELGQVVRVRPLIIDPNGTYNEELDEYVSYAPSKYFKVVAQT